MERESARSAPRRRSLTFAIAALILLVVVGGLVGLFLVFRGSITTASGCDSQIQPLPNGTKYRLRNGVVTVVVPTGWRVIASDQEVTQIDIIARQYPTLGRYMLRPSDPSFATIALLAYDTSAQSQAELQVGVASLPKAMTPTELGDYLGKSTSSESALVDECTIPSGPAARVVSFDHYGDLTVKGQFFHVAQNTQDAYIGLRTRDGDANRYDKLFAEIVRSFRFKS